MTNITKRSFMILIIANNMFKCGNKESASQSSVSAPVQINQSQILHAYINRVNELMRHTLRRIKEEQLFLLADFTDIIQQIEDVNEEFANRSLQPISIPEALLPWFDKLENNRMPIIFEELANSAATPHEQEMIDGTEQAKSLHLKQYILKMYLLYKFKYLSPFDIHLHTKAIMQTFIKSITPFHHPDNQLFSDEKNLLLDLQNRYPKDFYSCFYVHILSFNILKDQFTVITLIAALRSIVPADAIYALIHKIFNNIVDLDTAQQEVLKMSASKKEALLDYLCLEG